MKRRNLTLLSAALALGLMLTSCGTKTPPEETPAPTPEAVEPSVAPETGTRVITDMAGREVEVPAVIESVHSTSPIGQNLIYTIDPELLAGWCSPLRGAELHFIDEKYHDLPVLGGTFGKNNKLNPEVVIEAAPDIVLNVGTVNETTISDADKLQEQLGIPVIVAESNARNIDICYNFLGELLGREEICGKLSDYCRGVIDMVTETSAAIAPEDRVSVYYAENADGLATDPSGSPHAIVLDMVGCENVADVEGKAGYGRVEVSPEQILNWNPDMILICPEHSEDGTSLYGNLSSGSAGFWSDLAAVQNGQFYEVPVGPFNWFDRPPSVNQILGLQWCGNMVYPEQYDYDMEEVTTDFFDLFFHYDLTHEEYQELVKNSTR